MTNHEEAPSLEQKIQAAGGPVLLLRGPGQLGPYVFPGIAPEFTNWRAEVRSWKRGPLSWSSRTTCPNCICVGARSFHSCRPWR